MALTLSAWPGHPAYAGDMGSFVFARLDDMFQFFRTDRRDDRRRYQPQLLGREASGGRSGRTAKQPHPIL